MLLILTFCKEHSMVPITTKALKSALKMHLERVKTINFIPQERGHPFPWTTSPAALGLTTYQVRFWDAFSNLFNRALYGTITEQELKSGLKMQFNRFKNKKPPTQGKRTPIHNPNPLQPWPFGPLHMPSMLLMFLIQTSYTDLCMVSITTKVLKSGLKMRLARFINKKSFYPGKGDIPSFWTPSYTALAIYLAFYKDLCIYLYIRIVYFSFF